MVYPTLLADLGDVAHFQWTSETSDGQLATNLSSRFGVFAVLLIPAAIYDGSYNPVFRQWRLIAARRLPTTELTIYSEEGSHLIGHGHYTFSQTGNTGLLRGENR